MLAHERTYFPKQEPWTALTFYLSVTVPLLILNMNNRVHLCHIINIPNAKTNGAHKNCAGVSGGVPFIFKKCDILENNHNIYRPSKCMKPNEYLMSNPLIVSFSTNSRPFESMLRLVLPYIFITHTNTHTHTHTHTHITDNDILLIFQSECKWCPSNELPPSIIILWREHTDYHLPLQIASFSLLFLRAFFSINILRIVGSFSLVVRLFPVVRR